MGLILVIVAGAELFTGNNLIAMARASRLIRTRAVLKNWVIVDVGNVLGCFGTLGLVLFANTAKLNHGALGATAVSIATAKSELTFLEAFARGILCNALVCIAVWMAMGCRSVVDKIVAILFPITAFVALGFEHSIANWFLLPYGMALDTNQVILWSGALRNLTASTLGNIMGGTILVAAVYWLAFLRNRPMG